MRSRERVLALCGSLIYELGVRNGTLPSILPLLFAVAMYFIFLSSPVAAQPITFRFAGAYDPGRTPPPEYALDIGTSVCGKFSFDLASVDRWVSDANTGSYLQEKPYRFEFKIGDSISFQSNRYGKLGYQLTVYNDASHFSEPRDILEVRSSDSNLAASYGVDVVNASIHLWDLTAQTFESDALPVDLNGFDLESVGTGSLFFNSHNVEGDGVRSVFSHRFRIHALAKADLAGAADSDEEEFCRTAALTAPIIVDRYRKFESQEDFQAALNAHHDAIRAKEEQKIRLAPRRSAAEMNGAPPEPVRVAPAPPSAEAFRKRFEEKFNISLVKVDIDGKASGAPGKFEIEGDLVPAALQSGAGTTPLTPELVSGAFLMEEAEAFGIVDLEDLNLRYSHPGLHGVMLADYHREIGGLRFPDSDIRFQIDSNGHIRKIWGNIPPVPDDIYASVSRPILKKYEARDVAAAELLALGRSLFLSEIRPRLLLQSNSPYVIWRVENYSVGDKGFILSTIDIDAASGEIHEHRQSARHGHQN